MPTSIDLARAFAFFLREETGRSLMEHTLILAMVLVVCALALLAAYQIP